MATFFAVYAAMCSTIHEAVFTEILFDANMEERMARCEAVGIAIGRGEPIRNPVTLAAHRVRINLPNGFEYLQNEVGRGWSTSLGKVPMKLQDRLRPVVRTAPQPSRGDPRGGPRTRRPAGTLASARRRWIARPQSGHGPKGPVSFPTAQLIERHIPGRRLAPIVGGTVAVVDEMPEAFTRLVLEFLRS